LRVANHSPAIPQCQKKHSTTGSTTWPARYQPRHLTELQCYAVGCSWLLQSRITLEDCPVMQSDNKRCTKFFPSRLSMPMIPTLRRLSLCLRTAGSTPTTWNKHYLQLKIQQYAYPHCSGYSPLRHHHQKYSMRAKSLLPQPCRSCCWDLSHVLVICKRS